MSNSEKVLKAYIDRMATLYGEAAQIGETITDLAKEIKGQGFDAGIVKKLAKIQHKNTAEKEKEKNQLLQTYAAAAQLDLF